MITDYSDGLIIIDHLTVPQAEIDACIEKMADDNKLMRSDDTIFVI
jgi:hypothetical protein